MAPVVVFPEPGDGNPSDHIFVAKTDAALMAAHVEALGAWIRAAAACLEAHQ